MNSKTFEQGRLSSLNVRVEPQVDVLDIAATAVAEHSNASLEVSSSQLDFARATFTGRNGRVHTESRCNQCGFRITATTSDAFNDQEREHARACQGSEGE
jgi:hypothetical protein